MRYPDEPHMLVGSVLVHQGAVSLLDHLRARGHAVEVDAAGDLVVDGVETLPDDTKYVLEAFTEDLTILLTAGGVTVH
jgi:hypothetical protein